MQVQLLGQEEPLEEEMATHSSILAWKTHGQRSPADYSPKGCKESDMTEHACKDKDLTTQKEEIIPLLFQILINTSNTLKEIPYPRALPHHLFTLVQSE